LIFEPEKFKKKMGRISAITILAMAILSCEKEDDSKTTFTENPVDLSTHILSTYSIINNTNYLVVFESGLGDDHAVWDENNIISEVSLTTDILLYDRAGYGNSESGPEPRDINRLRSELESVVARFSEGRKIILVGHSIGGLIIRDYAIKNPEKTAALLFIDPTHEYYNSPSQSDEDMLVAAFTDAYGANSGGTMEIREIIEDLQYSSELPNLPDVPVIVLTSMKADVSNNSADSLYHKTRQDWYDAHELLNTGVRDFTHITTASSGHYIMREDPDMVIRNINLLLSKLP
jgi:pimeloyl-ACP methyl ester carboxylesterase